MGAESSGEKAIAVGNLEYVFLGGSVGGEGARDALFPHGEILAGVKHHDGFAGRAGGGVDAHNLTHRNCGQTKGVGVAQVGLIGEGQLRDVINTLNVIRRKVHLLEFLSVKWGVVIHVTHNLFQSSALNLAQLLTTHAFNALVPIHNKNR